MKLDSLSAIAAHRRELGDIVDETHGRLVVGTRHEGMPTAPEIRWRDETGSVHLFLWCA